MEETTAPEPERYTERGYLLDTAREAVLRQRNASYGEPDQDFSRTANILTALLGHKLLEGAAITSDEVAKILIVVKLSRLSWSPDHADSWIDIAGYAACGYETAILRTRREAILQKSSDA